MAAGTLLEHVTRQGLITAPQAAQVRRVIEMSAATGKQADASELLVSLGYLTPQQVKHATRALRTGMIQIPGLEVVGRLGRGGFGTVYKARQKNLDRMVAVKVMDPEWADDAREVQRFQNEIRSIAQLSHENLTTAMTAGRVGRHHYLVMEYVDGQPLSRILKDRAPLPVEEAVSVALQTARALAYAHAKGMVHRDVKPENILITAEGTAKLCDLGLARSAGRVRESRRLTESGVVLGTPHYMSPEQLRGAEDLDGRADLYSLGIILYEMLSGKLPFSEESTVAMIAGHLSEEMPPLREARPDAPRALEKIVEVLTRKPREDRYADASALIADLEKVQAGKPVMRFGPRRAGDTPPRGTSRGTPARGVGGPRTPGTGLVRPVTARPPLWWALVGASAAVLLITIVVVAIYADGRRDPPEERKTRRTPPPVVIPPPPAPPDEVIERPAPPAPAPPDEIIERPAPPAPPVRQGVDRPPPAGAVRPADGRKHWVGAPGTPFGAAGAWSSAPGGAANTTAPGPNDVVMFDGADDAVCVIDHDLTVAGIVIRKGMVTQTEGATLDIGGRGFVMEGGEFRARGRAVEIKGDLNATVGSLDAGPATWTVHGNARFKGKEKHVEFIRGTSTFVLTGRGVELATYYNQRFYKLTVQGSVAQSGKARLKVEQSLVVAGRYEIATEHAVGEGSGRRGAKRDVRVDLTGGTLTGSGLLAIGAQATLSAQGVLDVDVEYRSRTCEVPGRAFGGNLKLENGSGAKRTYTLRGPLSVAGDLKVAVKGFADLVLDCETHNPDVTVGGDLIVTRTKEGAPVLKFGTRPWRVGGKVTIDQTAVVTGARPVTSNQ